MISLSLISKDNFSEILPGGRNGEPEWISNNRNKAISQFSKLPFEVSPLYSKYTGLTMLEPENIFFSNAESSSLSKDLNIRLEEIKSGPSLIIVGSTVAHVYVPEQLSKQGLIISDIREAFAKHSELLKKHLDDNANNYGEDRFLSLGLSSFQSGFFYLHTKKLDRPRSY
jgi:Fe-S cluster assembly scaffold protein SufB